jgi:hypothetical protein
LAVKVPRSHHIDRRAAEVRDALTAPLQVELVRAGDLTEMEPLYSTVALAERLGVSVQFLTIGRVRGYGPKFVQLGPKRIRYRRSDVVAWLEQRTHASTSEYGGYAGPGQAAKGGARCRRLRREEARCGQHRARSSINATTWCAVVKRAGCF